LLFRAPGILRTHARPRQSSTMPPPPPGPRRPVLTVLPPRDPRSSWALPASRRPWKSAGLRPQAGGATDSDRRHDRHGRPRKGRPWGGVRAGAAAAGPSLRLPVSHGGSPSASERRLRGRGSVGPDGPVTDSDTSAGREARAPDRQQRAAALAGFHRVGRSLVTRATRPGPLGPSRTGSAGGS
jgi:hypothetical protein